MVSLLNIGDKQLLLDMGMSQRDFAKARLLPLLEEEGFLVANFRLTSWHFTEVIQQEDTITIAGPGFLGVTLYQLLQPAGNQQNPRPTIVSLTEALLAQILEAMELVLRQKPCFQFAGPAQILLSQDESGQTSILFLPPTLFRRAVESLSTQEQSHLLGRYENPLLEGEAALAFSQSVYLYQFLSCRHPTENQNLHLSEEGLPFPEMDPQRRLDDYRDKNFLPLELAVPGVSPLLAAAINHNLHLGSREAEAAKAAATKKSLKKRLPETDSPLLLAGMLGELEPGKLVGELSQEEKREITQRREAFCRRKGKRLERQRMVRRYSTWIRVAAAVLVAALVAGVIRFKDWRQEYVAYGLTPSQVCQVVYTALEEQNLVMAKAMVSKTGHKEAGTKAFLDRLSNFFVANRMRTGMDPTAITVTPQQWRQQPELQQRGEVWIYGIDRFDLWVDNSGIDRFDLQIDEIAETSAEGASPLLPCYPPKRKDRAEIQSAQEESAQESQQLTALATYDLVYSQGPDTITVESHRDQLTLEYRKGCWQVVAIRQEF